MLKGGYRSAAASIQRVRKYFFPSVKKDEGEIVKAFYEMSKRDALKKRPKVGRNPNP
jgi:hypothetical protein